METREQLEAASLLVIFSTKNHSASQDKGETYRVHSLRSIHLDLDFGLLLFSER